MGKWRIDKSLKRLSSNKEPYANECRNALNLVKLWHISDLGETGNKFAARSAAWSAWSDYYKEEAEELLKLLSESK